MAYSTHPDYGPDYAASWRLGSGEDRKLWREVSAIMDQHHPRLMMINFHQTDRSGHLDGWLKYTQRILWADRIVYEMWTKIQRHPFYANRTTLIVTNDHGRHTDDFTRHGDCCEGCQHVMFLALGPDIRQGHTSGGTERHPPDISATAGFLLGLPMPHALDGRIMREIFRDGVTVPGDAEPLEPQLVVDVITVDADGQPQQVFRPGDAVGVETVVCNPGPLGVEVFQAKAGIPVCSTGRNYRNSPIYIAPGECYTELEYRDLPLATPGAEWLFDFEYRGIDDDGNVALGTASIAVTTDAP